MGALRARREDRREVAAAAQDEGDNGKAEECEGYEASDETP
jgi:hypothetical protein